MADPEFEIRLSRLFGEAPALPDADGFASRVEARLDRAWMVRRFLIGSAGVVGGALAAGQMLGARVLEHAANLGNASATTVSHSAKALGQLRLLTDLPVGGEVMWVGAGLAVLAVLLFATRALEEF